MSSCSPLQSHEPRRHGVGEAVESGGDFHNFLHTPRKGHTSDQGARVGKEGTLLRSSGSELGSNPYHVPD